MIGMEILDPEEAAEDDSIDDDGDVLDEEGESGSGEAGVITGLTEVGTKEVEELYQAVKYSSLFSYVLKPTSLLTQGFKDNKKSQ